MPSSAPDNAASRRAIKIVATLVAGLVVLFAVNTAQSGTDESATALSTQSLLSLPADDSPTPPPTAIPTTAPLSLPTATATPLPTATPAPTATAAPTATPVPTATAVPTPAPTAETVVESAESQPAPTAPPAPTAAVEPTAAPEPTATAVVEPTATPPPTATPLPDPTPIAPLVEQEPTATPEPTPEPTATAIPVQTVADLEVYVLGEINQIRANAGLSPLALDPAISEVSRDWSRQMAQGGFFNHRPSDQINVMLPAGWRQWGENIASAPDIFYAQDSLEASPGHYANMVGPFTHVGIGVYTNGRQVWVTQNFARY